MSILPNEVALFNYDVFSNYRQGNIELHLTVVPVILFSVSKQKVPISVTDTGKC